MPSRSRSVNPSGGTLRRALVIAEVAVAVTLLIGAGLTIHSMSNLRRSDIGFDPDGLVAMQIDVPPEAFGPQRLGTLAQEIIEAVSARDEVDTGYIWSPHVPGQSSWYTAVGLLESLCARVRHRRDRLDLLRCPECCNGRWLETQAA